MVCPHSQSPLPFFGVIGPLHSSYIMHTVCGVEKWRAVCLTELAVQWWQFRQLNTSIHDGYRMKFSIGVSITLRVLVLNLFKQYPAVVTYGCNAIIMKIN